MKLYHLSLPVVVIGFLGTAPLAAQQSPFAAIETHLGRVLDELNAKRLEINDPSPRKFGGCDGGGLLMQFNLKHIDAAAAEKSIQEEINNGKIDRIISFRRDTASNSVLVYAPPYNIEKVQKLLDKMDVPKPAKPEREKRE